jgi:hypothetical protein
MVHSSDADDKTFVDNIVSRLFKVLSPGICRYQHDMDYLLSKANDRQKAEEDLMGGDLSFITENFLSFIVSDLRLNTFYQKPAFPETRNFCH